MPIIEQCSPEIHGTRLTLTGLNQNLKFPMPDALREALIRDYGREQDFSIFVDGEKLSFEHIHGETQTIQDKLDGIGPVTLAFTVAEAKRPFKEAGISVRVNGKVVGKPEFFGLEESDDFPKKVLGKIYGEVEADGLLEDVTADWGAIIDNSNGYETLKNWGAGHIREAAKKIYGMEII